MARRQAAIARWTKFAAGAATFPRMISESISAWTKRPVLTWRFTGRAASSIVFALQQTRLLPWLKGKESSHELGKTHVRYYAILFRAAAHTIMIPSWHRAAKAKHRPAVNRLPLTG